MSNTEIRFATEEDVGLILEFIKDLADYEKMSNQVVADEALLREWIFEKKKAEVLFAMEDGGEVGFALFSITSPPSSAERAFILRISTSRARTEVTDTARP